MSMIHRGDVLPAETVLHESNRKVPSQEKRNTDTSEAGPEPEPGTVQMSSCESSRVCVCVRGGLGGPEPSNVSLKSDSSIRRLVDFSNGRQPEDQVKVERVEIPAGQSGEHQTPLCSMVKMLKEKIDAFVDGQLEVIQNRLRSGFPQSSEIPEEDEEKRQANEALMVIIKYILRGTDQDTMAEWISESPYRVCQRHLKSILKEKFQCLSEGIGAVGKAPCLDEVYTELFITEGRPGGVNQEHEVRQLEAASWRAGRAEKMIRSEDIFNTSPGRKLHARRVMTKGVAGIGKTVLTQKFTLDWAEDKANKDVDFTFPFAFRELNLLRGTKCSLVDLLHRFFASTKRAGICRFDGFRLVFIFDGLDECRLPLDFHNNESVSDISEPASVDALLTNLMAGNLLPSAHIWITTRPGAADRIPPPCIDMVTEIQGFSNQQKEEYFRKRFHDQEEASRIISHVRTLRSLHIMCHIPVFCWIIAKVLEHMLRNREGEELPRTLTEMYIYFLLVQSKLKGIKYEGGAAADPHWNPGSVEMMEALGKLAYEQLQKGNLIFYESDLAQCGIDARAAAVYSGVFTQIFKEMRGLFNQKVFCFVHLSVQEFLAALYVHLRYFGSGDDLLSDQFTAREAEPGTDEGATVRFYQRAVDEALQSPHGTLDLFLRFLLGLSLPTNQSLLHGFLRQPAKKDTRIHQTLVDFIKEKIEKAPSAEQSINLFHCLNELNDRSLVEQIQQSMSSSKLSTGSLSPAQWSALVFILLSSEKHLQVFDLKRFSASEEALLKLLPVIKASKTALLDNCNLSEQICRALSSVLGSSSSALKELDLSNNNLRDCGLKLLCAGLESPHCSLESLRLSGCLLTDEACASLASVLSAKHSRLRMLDLSYNHLGEAGAKLLSARLAGPLLNQDNLRLAPAGVQWLRPGLQKYRCELTFDTNTLNRKLQLSDEARTVGFVEEEQSYPDHPDRFEWWPQVLCTQGVTGRCYWEVECEGRVFVSVSYRSIRRKGDDGHCEFGENDHSWRLNCYGGRYSVCHDSTTTSIPSPSPSPSPSHSHRVAVYVDWPAGLLSFYIVGTDSLIHLKTFSTTFTKPLHPGFGFWFWPGSSVSLCSQ